MVERTLRFKVPHEWSLCVLREDCEDGKPWFCLHDMGQGLGYRHAPKAKSKMLFVESENSSRRMAFISEGEAFLLIMKCRLLTEAQKMQIVEAFQAKGYMFSVYLSARQEVAFVDMLEQCLSSWGISGQRQYRVGQYRIDFYIHTLRLAVEFDENSHRGYSAIDEKRRQQYIEERLGCRFVRVTNDLAPCENLGIVMKAVTENCPRI